MIKGLFIHDHKFPAFDSSYFYSYGFDKEFILRYKSLFDELHIIGRRVSVDKASCNYDHVIDNNVNFYTIKSYVELIKKKTREELKKEICSCDIAVVRMPSILGLIAMHILKKTKKAYLIELVGCPWDAFRTMGATKMMFATFMTLATKISVWNSKFTVYVTEQFLQRRYPSKGESISCSNVTIDEPDKNLLDERIQSIKRFSLEHKIIVGTIGTIDSRYKGQQYVIGAIANLKRKGYDIEYHLVGGGNKSYLLQLAKDNGVEENVYFEGRLEHERIFSWLKNIDIYVQPSDAEGLPRSIIEAMSTACPIIGSDAGGIPELIDISFVFKKGNINEICNQIESMTIDKMLEAARNNFSNAKKYQKSILDVRRKDFFNKLISQLEK